MKRMLLLSLVLTGSLSAQTTRVLTLEEATGSPLPPRPLTARAEAPPPQ